MIGKDAHREAPARGIAAKVVLLDIIHPLQPRIGNAHIAFSIVFPPKFRMHSEKSIPRTIRSNRATFLKCIGIDDEPVHRAGSARLQFKRTENHVTIAGDNVDIEPYHLMSISQAMERTPDIRVRFSPFSAHALIRRTGEIEILVAPRTRKPIMRRQCVFEIQLNILFLGRNVLDRPADRHHIPVQCAEHLRLRLHSAIECPFAYNHRIFDVKRLSPASRKPGVFAVHIHLRHKAPKAQ